MNTTSFAVEIEEKRISAILSVPDRSEQPIVILVHGGPGGTKEGPSDLFIKMSERLARAGIASVRFDFLGAGDSDGEYVDMTIAHQVLEYTEVLDYVKAQGFGNIGLLGESLGATIALAGFSTEVKALALLWPAIYLMDTSLTVYLSDSAQEELRLKGYLLEDDIRVGKAFIDEFQKLDNVESYLRRVAVPTLLIHGDSDSEVPHHQTEKAYSLLPDPKKKIVVPGGDHCLRKPEEQTLVITEVVRWFGAYLA